MLNCTYSFNDMWVTLCSQYKLTQIISNMYGRTITLSEIFINCGRKIAINISRNCFETMPFEM